jgi:hypothetical protein
MEIRSILAGVVIGLLIGAAVSFLINVPAIMQIDSLQGQVTNLESQISDKNAQIGNLTSQITHKNAQITNLTNTIDQLQAQLPPERKGEYNLVATFRGQLSGSTDYFYLDEPDIMVTWNWTSSSPRYAVLVLSLWKQNASAFSASWTYLPRNGSTFIHNVQTAYYYMNINAVNLDSWAVSIYKWVPA